MALDLPRTITPNNVSAFTNLTLAFRFTVIEHRPEPPSPHAVKGTLVHAALEGLFWRHEAGSRSEAAAHDELQQAWAALQSDPEYTELGLSEQAAEAFLADARFLVANYFRLEDPDSVRTIGVELGVEYEHDGLRLRGIIDRLDIGPDGALTVVDYKTGRAPSERYEHGRMAGVQTYALLCEKILGRPPPAEVRLLHLRDPLMISALPTAQTIRRPATADDASVWGAIEAFPVRTRTSGRVPGPLCDYCNSPNPPARPSERRERDDGRLRPEKVDAAFEEPWRGRPGP